MGWAGVAWQDRGREWEEGTKSEKRNIYPLDLIFWHRRETCVKIGNEWRGKERIGARICA